MIPATVPISGVHQNLFRVRSRKELQISFVPGPHFWILLDSLRSGLSDPKESWASDWYWVQYLVSLLRKHDVCKLCSFLNRNLPCHRLWVCWESMMSASLFISQQKPTLSYIVSLLRKLDVCKLVHVSKETYPIIDCEFVKKAWCLQACSRLKRNLPCHDSSGSSTSQTHGECPSVCVLNPIKEWLIYLNFYMRLHFSQHYWVYENCSGIVIWLLCVVQNL
jgi:hypothetical protein